MSTCRWILGAAVALATVGCQTTPLIDSAQPAAIESATKRGQFESQLSFGHGPSDIEGECSGANGDFSLPADASS